MHLVPPPFRHLPLRSFRRRAAGFALLAVLLLPLAGCSGGILQPAGRIGAADTKILFDAVEIMSAIVVPTILGALAFAWWFRASNSRAQYQPDFVYSGRIEIIVWSIPILVILFLGGVIWIGSHELDPFEPIAASNKPRRSAGRLARLEVAVHLSASRIASVNEVVVPAGVPVHFSLTSATVMNAFFVPQLGSMIATMNGMADPALSPGRPCRGFLRRVRAIQRRRVFRHAFHRARGRGRTHFAQWVARRAQVGPALDRTQLRRAGAGKPEHHSPSPTARSIRRCSTPS